MVLLVFGSEERCADEELIDDASKAPHIDGCRVWNAQDDLWSTVESGLDVGVYLLVLEAPTAKINDLDPRLVNLLHQYILRLQVTMNDVVLRHEVK